MKREKISITTWAVGTIIVLLLAANIVTSFLLMNQYKRAMKDQIHARMLDISDTAAYMIDGDAYETVQSRDPGNVAYVEIYNILDSFQENINLEFIYCIREMEDGTYIFTIDPAKVDCSEYGELVHVTEALKIASRGESAVDEEPYEDSYGRFYSAYSPIFNSKNEVIGIIAVDFSAAWFDRQVKNARLIMVGSVLSLTVGALIVLMIKIRITRGEMRKTNKHANYMITALASDYRSVYYVNLDKDSGTCYRARSKMENGLAEGEQFVFSEKFTEYAKDFVTEEYRERFLDFIKPEAIRAALEKERLIAFTYLTVRDGVESYEMLRMACVRTAEERMDGLIHSVGVGFTDVDEQTRQAIDQRNALKEALANAEAANKAKSAFLSSMSHEIRTPMNAIIGLDRLAMDENELPDSVKDYLKQIASSADHLLKIINDILDISRIESGSVTLKNEDFSFRKLIESIDSMIGAQCKERGLDYESIVDDRIADYYMSDEMKLRQVLLNILGNAVKFTPEGGRVSMTANFIAKFENKSTIRFVLKDTGIGMDESYIPKLFDPFSQENSSTTTKYGSTGLGMAITKNIVDMMNGEIEVESTKGVGTTFTVTVTLDNSNRKDEEGENAPAEVKASADKETAASENRSFEGTRVLLAEDVEVNARIMMKLLGLKKIEVERADNGRIATEMFAEHPENYYDVILMDIRMPEIDGLQATEIIRAMDRADAKTIPIIALTANAFDEDVQNSLQFGINAHLSKPVVPEEVYKALDEYIIKK